MDSDRRLSLALRLQERGRISAAIRVCLGILQLDPRHAEAIHTLGALAVAGHEWQVALGWFRKAASLDPREVRYHNSLAISLWFLNRGPEAIVTLDRGLRICPEE